MTLEEARVIMGRVEDYPETEDPTATKPKQQEIMWFHNHRIYCLYFNHRGVVDGQKILVGPKQR